MKAFKALLLLSSLTLPVALFAGHSDKKYAGKPIVIQPNQSTLKVTLDANATTGYSWFLNHYNKRFLKLKSYHYVAGDANRPGAPGKATFTFKVNPRFHRAPFKSAISLTYMRPWDASTAVNKRLMILSIPLDKPIKKHHHKPQKMKLDTKAVKQQQNAPQITHEEMDHQIKQVSSKVTQPAKPDPNNWLSTSQ